MATTRQTLKEYFKKYATPTEAQFAALIDSFVHKDEDSLTQEKIDGLTAALNDKVSTQDLGSAVATAVAEALQGGNLEVTPAAHEHAVSDISGLGARLTTLETSKADYEAFKTLVTAFLNDADVSDTTINRWKELEDFLSGITDSDTLAGMLQALKAEILAEVPQPQTGNYLEQVTDMAAALQTAEVGKIVQYVGQSDAEYTRGLCYEKKEGHQFIIPKGSYVIQLVDVHKSAGENVDFGDDFTFYRIARNENEPKYGDVYPYAYAIPLTVGKHVNGNEIISISPQSDGRMLVNCGDFEELLDNVTIAEYVYVNAKGIIAILNASATFSTTHRPQNHSCSISILNDDKHDSVSGYYSDNFITWITTEDLSIGYPSTWQPLVTSPVVS